MRLAKKFDGEIVSADSRQVYRGLDIGTGKVRGEWRQKTFVYKAVPHHCLDFVSPKKTYTAAEYQKCAKEAIKDVARRGKLPILAGGAGFWIDAVVYDLQLPEVPPDRKLRRKLEKKSPQELLKILQGLDAKRARTVEEKNPRRLIRAIEIARALGKVPKLKQKNIYQALWIGLNPSEAILEKRIKARAQKMIAAGLVKETKKLLHKGVGKKRIREFGFEYRLALAFLEKKISRRELSESMVRESLQYARRQETWFKRNRKIRWVKKSVEAEKICRKFISPSHRPI